MIETPFSGFTSSTDKQKEKIELTLDRLKDNSIRYESHKVFLNRLAGIETYNWKLRSRVRRHMVFKTEIIFTYIG